MSPPFQRSVDPSNSPTTKGQTDEVEHIPWGQITVNGPERPAWQSPLAVALAALALLGLIAFRTVRATPAPVVDLSERVPETPAGPNPSEETTMADIDPTADDLPPAGADDDSPGDGGTVGDETVDAGTVGGVQGPAAYAEADLLAYVPVLAEVAARARAEWFVRDYFSSTDGDRRAALEAALPESIDVPDARGDAISHVDWARAYDVRAGDGDRDHVVTVLYRPLVSAGPEGYVSSPVRAVEVDVVVAPDGASTVADLPTPVPLPSGVDLDGPARVPEVMPAERAADVIDGLAGLIPAPSIVLTERAGSVWRVVVESTDATGLVWTYALWVEHAPSAETGGDAGSGG